MLEVLGDIGANVIAPRAAEADEEGAQFNDGEVTYAAATQAGIEALKKAELMGVMLPWAYGGLNLPESIYQIMVEMVSRADAGLMTIFGLQEIAASINEFGDEPTKARILPRFARGEVAGAMVLTEPDAGSDLGAVQTPRRAFDEATGNWRLNGVKRFITNGCAESSWCWRAAKKAPRMHAGCRSSSSKGMRRCASAASRTRWASTLPPPARSSTTTPRLSWSANGASGCCATPGR